MENNSYEKIAKTLRTDRDVLRTVEEKLSGITGKKGVLENIFDSNKKRIEYALDALDFRHENMRAGEIYSSLIDRIREDDIALGKLITSFQNMIDLAKETADVGTGMFLKLDKARELVSLNPPQKILEFLGYSNVQELLEKEDIFEIFAGLRFIEDMEWLNNIFFKPYENLTPDDFEEREIRGHALNEKWIKAAEHFVEKKYHNLSHLKELGFVFIIPVDIKIPGATLNDFSLALHYFHEIKFYSDLFKKFSAEENFARKFTASLRGDVLNNRPPEENMGSTWLIVQRYLAKDDEYDWRLFYPHVNPEAVHWFKAERDIAKFSKKFGLDFSFWQGMGPVGDFFRDDAGIDILVSFNFLDTVMSLFKEKEMIKYLYHHQEALWNKIFSEYFGEEKMEEMLIQNFDKGIIKL
ncbi:MAG: Uncharacterized protein Athens071424_166 [Parcubacteria group bacterium Athens0714_24]|nr:MAG: Uncharacterized protein Athens071424_166 [Parcubacteria group bacterium Athens0714_24]